MGGVYEEGGGGGGEQEVHQGQRRPSWRFHVGTQGSSRFSNQNQGYATTPAAKKEKRAIKAFVAIFES